MPGFPRENPGWRNLPALRRAERANNLGNGAPEAYHHHEVSYGWYCSSPMTERVDIDYTATPSPTRTHTIQLEAARDSDPDCTEALTERRSAPDPGWETTYRELSSVPVYIQIVGARLVRD